MSIIPTVSDKRKNRIRGKTYIYYFYTGDADSELLFDIAKNLLKSEEIVFRSKSLSDFTSRELDILERYNFIRSDRLTDMYKLGSPERDSLVVMGDDAIIFIFGDARGFWMHIKIYPRSENDYKVVEKKIIPILKAFEKMLASGKIKNR